METFSIAAAGDDGQVEARSDVDGPYPPDGSLNTVDTAGTTISASKRHTFGRHRITVALLRFDTSILPDNADVIAAILRLQVISKQDMDNRMISAEWYASSNWPIDAADWTSTVGTNAHAGADITGITAGAELSLSLVNLSNISKITLTGLRLHVTGGETPVDGINEIICASLEHATLAEPQLDVTYTVPSLTSYRKIRQPKRVEVPRGRGVYA